MRSELSQRVELSRKGLVFFGKPVATRLNPPSNFDVSGGSENNFSIISWETEQWQEPDATEADDELAGKCLNEFLKFADMQEPELSQRVGEFIQRRGVLGIWPKLRSTGEVPHLRTLQSQAESNQTKNVHPLRYSESVASWVALARAMAGAIEVSAYLRKNVPVDIGRAADSKKYKSVREEMRGRCGWKDLVLSESISDFDEDDDKEPQNADGTKLWEQDDIEKWDADRQQQVLSEKVTEWLEQLAITPKMFWHKDGPQVLIETNCSPAQWDNDHYGKTNHPLDIRQPLCNIKLRPSRLFNLLMLQLVFVMASGYDLYPCKYCGEVFARDDKKQRYCPDKKCYENERREKMKDYQRKKRGQRS